MKKIVTEEERLQLYNNGIFLEGYFNSINSLGNVTQGQIIIVLIVGALFVYIGLYIQITGWLLGALLIYVSIYPMLYRPCFRRFLKRKSKQLLAEEHIEINWATIVQIDEDNRRISFMEDDVMSPECKPYIVDYIATESDCRSVVKGERIILVHSWDKKGKEAVLPMIPKPEFALMREKEKCAPVNVIGVEHVPHVNAFSLDSDEVIFHSRFSEVNTTVDLKKYGWSMSQSNKYPTAIFVYKRSGDGYELRLCWTDRVRRWSYGDILQMKRKKFTVGKPQYYFVSKHD